MWRNTWRFVRPLNVTACVFYSCRWDCVANVEAHSKPVLSLTFRSQPGQADSPHVPSICMILTGNYIQFVAWHAAKIYTCFPKFIRKVWSSIYHTDSAKGQLDLPLKNVGDLLSMLFLVKQLLKSSIGILKNQCRRIVISIINCLLGQKSISWTHLYCRSLSMLSFFIWLMTWLEQQWFWFYSFLAVQLCCAWSLPQKTRPYASGRVIDIVSVMLSAWRAQSETVKSEFLDKPLYIIYTIFQWVSSRLFWGRRDILIFRGLCRSDHMTDTRAFFLA